MAVDNSTTTNEDQVVTLATIQTNDSDADGSVVVNTIDLDPIQAGQQTTFSNSQGEWVLNTTTGNVVFTPAPNFNGSAAIQYTIADNAGATSNTANLTVIVNPVNDAPVVDNDVLVTNEDTSNTGDVTDTGDSDPDGTPLTVNTTPVSGPNNGTIIINADGTYTYYPATNFNGTDIVVVSVCDAGTPGISCVNDTIFITVNPINDGPTIDNENITIEYNGTATGDLTDAGDFDIDGNLVVTTTPINGPNNGTIDINPDGTFTYEPFINYVGTDMIIVQICDDGTPTPIICVNDTIFITVNPCSATDLLADCDQDGVTNGDEIDPDGDGTPGPNGTDPFNPCSFNSVDQNLAQVSAAWLAADCDGDGVTNGEEVDPDGDGTPGPNGTDPNDPCEFDLALQDFAGVSAAWLTTDCDGDGVTNGEEVDPNNDGTPGPNGTDPSNPCDYDVALQDFASVSAAWLAADCDGDGVTNEEEVDPDGDGTPGPNGTDPSNPCSFDFNDATVAPSAAWLAADCDGDGVTNEEEVDPDGDGTPGPNGTDPSNPCDYDLALQDFASVSAAWLAADCDGDGVTNGDEIDPDGDGTPGPNGTDPSDPCDLTIADQTVEPSPEWLAADCDGDGVNNGDEVTGGSDPFNPCSPRPCDIFIPQAFTPDGDGINDYFVINGIELFPENEIVILNRWGSVVFQTTNYQNDWNGTSSNSMNIGGGDLPTGTYYYILDPKKEGYDVYKGYIYLQR